MSVVGEIALWMALLFAVWCAVAGVVGGRTGREALVASARRSLLAAAAMFALATAGIASELARRDLALAFVAQHASADLPPRYAIAALWSSGAGASLLLALLAALACALVLPPPAQATRAVRGLGVAIAGLALTWLVGPLCASNVLFARLEWIPPDGAGLAPALQSAFMLLQPPLALLGWALALPLAVATLAALAGRSGASPSLLARRLALGGVVVSVLAMGLAARWAQRDPLWTDRWMARPVLDGSLVALVIIVLLDGACRARRRAWRRFAPAAAVVAIAAVLAVGSRGVRDVVRAESLLPSPAALGLLGLAALVAIVVARRARRVDVPVTHPLAPRGDRVRRAGWIVAVAGLAGIAIAARGATERVAHEVELPTGAPVAIAGLGGDAWTAVGQGISRHQAENRAVTELGVELRRGEGAPQLVTAERWQPVDRRDRPRGDAAAVLGVRSGLARDVTLELRDPREGGALATIAFQPLASLYWLGGVLLLAGLVLALRD